MFTNYFLTALRALKRQKLNTLLNVLGLSVGMSSVAFLALFAITEFDYDKYHQQSGDIYRLAVNFPDTNLGKEGSAVVPGVFKSWLPEQFPQEVSVTTHIGQQDPFFSLYKDNERLNNIPINWADQDLGKVFDIPVVAGDLAFALSKPNQLAISETVARSLFGRTNVVGESLLLNNVLDVTVQAVFKDLPLNTHLSFSALVSMPTLEMVYPDRFESWTNIFFYSYLVAQPNANIELLDVEINRVWNDRNTLYDVDALLQPLESIHLDSNLSGEMKVNGSNMTVSLSILLAVMIITVACFNYINITTARASARAKEIGVRLSLGAGKRDIAVQFLFESYLLTLVSAAFTVICVLLFLPTFNGFTGKSILYLDLINYMPHFFVLVLFVSIAAGAYPAFFVSSYRLALILSGELSKGKKSTTLRKGLVFAQSSLTVVLLVLSLVAYKQIKLNESLPMGYDREQVVLLTIPQINGVEDAFHSMKIEMLANPNIISLTSGNAVPTMQFQHFAPEVNGDFPGKLNQIPFIGVNYDYLHTFGIKPLAGRDFSEDFSADWYTFDEGTSKQSSPGVIINKAAMRAAGWQSPDEVIGKRWSWDGIDGRIVAVIEDVKFQSVRESTDSFFMILGSAENTGTLAIKISNNNVANTMDFIDETFSKFYPVKYVDSRFLSSDFAEMYRQEAIQASLLIAFTLLTIFVTCLGLVGLAMFVAQKRTKEIAIRKVLGASNLQINWLLSKDFLQLVLSANVVAWPVAYLVSESWLSNYVERTDVGLLVFVFAAVITNIVAWITVSAVSAHAARMRVVDALHDE